MVDFASDILMFVGMSIILFTWDPLLAVAGLLPLPLVGWLVYYVRGQLQHGFTRGGRAWSPGIHDHPAHLRGAHLGIAQPAVPRELEELLVGHGRPQAIGQPGGELVVADRDDVAGGPLALIGGEEEELRRHQHRLEHELDRLREHLVLAIGEGEDLEQEVDLLGAGGRR